MTSLQASLELDLSKINFLERKNRITHPKTILSGPPKSGKSFLIYDYLSNFNSEEYLYLDLEDFKNDLQEIKENLQEFIKEHEIKVVVLENYHEQFELPQCESIILTCHYKLQHHGFKSLELMPLDFEEFLLHDQRHQNEITSFNLFYKYGNLPGVINYDEHKKEKRLQEIIKIYAQNPTEVEVLKQFFLNIDEKKSINQLFLNLKKNMKISKDKFYALCKMYEENRVIFQIGKFAQPKAVKKIYCFNHAFLNALTHTKKFKNQFSNMVFLELLKKEEPIFYLDHLDFYIPNENLVIIAHPFFNRIMMQAMFKKAMSSIASLNIDQVYIITIGNSDQFKHDDKQITVLPFYEWSLI